MKIVAKILCGATRGIEGIEIEVEVDLTNGMPIFEIVGLPDGAIKESKERIKSAFKNSGFTFPLGKVIVNLAPANIRKEGSFYDLPIAIGILAVSGVIKYEDIKNKFFIGELSLNGEIRGIQGALPIIDSLFKKGYKEFYIPLENAEEVSVLKEIDIYVVENLKKVVNSILKVEEIKKFEKDIFFDEEEHNEDFFYVKGQEVVKRAIVVACSGRHNMLIVGPPGTGKTMMASRIPTVLPDLTFEEQLEVTKIYSVANVSEDKKRLIKKVPYRAPHNTISDVALIGGGKIPKPGEISLAHCGVLFLDEFTEFSKNALENMRQPLEDKIVSISRVNGNVVYPCKFMLVAAMNPCPCGYYGASNKCTCNSSDVKKYLSKISGPMLDRIDIQVEANSVAFDELSENPTKETSMSSKDMKEIVKKVTKIQRDRYKNENINYNSELTEELLEKYCYLGDEEKEILKIAFSHYEMSGRAYTKVLKTARTIADMEGALNIDVKHISEAISYRMLDRKYFV
ncbi:MAG: YifB family Mg chelatase-like AAA ATPase [Lachnospirales bacterium]